MDPLSPIPWLNATGRLGIAILFAAIIGLDREFNNKPAGLRTNMLVSLGAALFVLVTVQSGLVQTDSSSMARTLQGIITGVGFVGAGSILREDRVRGLTSATAVWISAGVGVAAGLGQWQLGLLGTGFALIILRLMKFAEKHI
ncbi:MgtC/SapB family protein [Nodosilinea sp. LEGE 07298]|jgi:putative Mg2+ transporter-C (MgtC) family protein|uniref:MgtC/SapB family protein n=1 Tax=Nodosilinea sp. LEGE 07298 TaxID=2777970 RepID=UPI00187E25F7|nr:MgtC/SapB family protein [Nodosilinea sp. LEGE 07298]MBE9108684.1 MgtC/SapB family protein [Nodosilinea sp. LEGE 07298]